MANLNTFDTIHELLKQCLGLSGKIGMEKGMTFVRLATRLKDEILMQQRPSYNPEEPPDRLPEKVSEFQGYAVNIPDEYIEGCWNVFRQLVWHRDANGTPQVLTQSFLGTTVCKICCASPFTTIPQSASSEQ